MARVTLGTGESITIGGVTEVFGTSGAQSVTILDGSSVTFRSGFNSGGDTIRLTGNADDFTAVLVGSNVQLTSAVDGITITIPVGPIANTLVFDNGDSRDLSLDTATGTVLLGDQTIGGSPVDLTAGPGVYFVESDGDVTEGGDITFTVTRTDATSAETLQFTVQGDTVSGSVPAATAGADFTVAGNTIQFAAGQTTATFTVSANLDNNVEGLEGLGVKILAGQEVVAETTALIVDANTVGQTFELTPGIDTIGTGAATDLIGSEGSTNTNGQDTIIGVAGAFGLNNLGGSDFNAFDNINGGAERDTLIVLDQGGAFTNAPSFFGVTIQNVEELQYTAPTRGFSGNALNTTSWTGLEEANIMINAGAGGAQTVTLASSTSLSLMQAGSADLIINGGGGALSVSATTGDVTIGQTTAANAWTTVNVVGGDDVSFIDRGAADAVDVVLDGFGGDATLNGSQITSATIQNLDGGNRTVTVLNTVDTVVNLSDINVNDLDVFAPTTGSNLTVNVNGAVSGLDTIEADQNVTLNNNWADTLFLGDINSTSIADIDDVVTINANNGSIVGGDINATNFVNDVIVVNLNATGGDITLDDINGTEITPEQLAVNITGSGDVFFDTVSGTTITRTGSGDTTIGDLVGAGPYRSELSTTTQFDGSAGTGDDTMTFAAGNQQTNTFGGGDDFVALNGALGVNGSLDGGDDYDTLAMESNSVAAWTAMGPTATSNFEQLELTGQDVAQHDVIDLGNIGFDGQSDVDSFVGAGTETEVVTVSFAGAASSADQVTFDGETVTFADGDTAVDLAAAFVAQTGGETANWTFVDNGDGTITLTAKATGEVADLTAGDFVFSDATTPGLVGFEQVTGAPNVANQGVTPVAATAGVFTFNIDGLQVLNETESFGLSTTVDGGGDFLFTAPGDLSTAGFELQEFIVAEANADPDWSAIFTTSLGVNGELIFTAVNPQFLPGGIVTFQGTNTLTFSPTGGTFITQGSDPVPGETEDVYFVLDGTATGNDFVTFDGVTITFDDGDLPADLAAAFIAQYNLDPNAQYVASAPDAGEPGFGVDGAVELNSKVQANLTDVTAGDFTFIDDTNEGTPSVGVNVDQQGSTASVTLNNFISGSALTLNAALGTHTVNMTTDTASDEMTIVLAANGNHGTVTANDAETVTIDTDSVDDGGTDSLVLNDTDLTTLNVSGAEDLTLDTNSTLISNIDATGLGGTFTWTADANTVAITVETGPGGSDVDFSAMTLPGGNTFTGNAPVLFIGGSGNDTVTTGDQGSSRGTITTGAGFDTIEVGIVDGGNDYWSVTDFTAGINGDTLDFDGPVSFAGLDQELEPTATFQDYLDQAADGDVVGAVHFFYWEGDTYVVQDNTVGEDFQDGSDTVIRLEGIIDLQSVNIT